MAAPKSIIRLVDTFHRNIDSFKSGNYNETQVRREFIDPLFKALGWDIDNEKGYAEAYKDVIHEYSQKTKDTVKAPDYYFRIGGTGKFFVEAKKPSVNLKYDIHPAFQLRRYGWSAKLPLSILTDFEEFAVYDCRIPPKKNDKASTARIKFITYDEYIERWDEIEEVFSREAVLKGSFDKFAESTKKKRGTAEVDDAFLKAMEAWRMILARNIALRNSSLSIRELNFSVQKTIDRMIFLRICEDRGIEDYGELMNLLNGENIYGRLKQIFTRADEKYNSGLFHFEVEKEREEPPDELTPNISIDDKTLKEIIKNLYYPESPYEFSVLPADILGQVYEQFLGKVIRLTPAHHAVIEDKPEVKKAGGVYYTPTYIVDYIVKNTVGKILEKKTPKQVSKVKILDPACGSGSFLLGAYQHLLDWHLDYYNKHINEKGIKPGSKKSPVYEAANGEIKLTTAERKRILLNNIYGVDIDTQAVEVTKLSLLLKVLEGESEETLNNQMRMFRERALPDLTNNIKCGNSLIGPDFYEQTELNFLDEEEKLRINVFDWNTEFPDIFKTGGFDVVIGNPPYGTYFSKIEKKHLSLRYETNLLRVESYLLFCERSIKNIKPKGYLGVIIPDTYLNLDFTRKFREYLLRNTKLNKIVILPSRIFIKASVDTTILISQITAYQKSNNISNVEVSLFDKNIMINSIKDPRETLNISTKTWIDNNSFSILSNSKESNVIQRIDSKFPLLKEFANIYSGIKVYEIGKGNPKQTKQIRDSKPYTSDIKIDNIFSPFLNGKDITRYRILWNNNNWIKYGDWLAAPRNKEIFFGEKILIRKIVDKTLMATYLESEFYCNTLLFILKIKNTNLLSYLYLLAILNSKFIGWYFKKKFLISKEDTFPQIMIRDILNFSIPISSISEQNKLNSLSLAMINKQINLFKSKTPQEKTALQRQIDATDKQIDQLVYQLYGLTDEEIKIVEGE